MKLVNKTLYIEFADFIAAGWNVDGIKKANLRNGSFWQMIANPEDARAVLVEYESLRPNHKEKIEQAFGNPYDCLAKGPIKKLVTKDLKAEEFYLNYRYAENKTLPVDHISKYTSASSILNMITRVTADSISIKEIIKEQLHLTVDKFYNNIIDIIKAEELPLPKTYSHLLRKIKEYKTEGYGCLIDWRFGNQLAAKINDEVSEAQLLTLIENPLQYDAVLIAKMYNIWAAKNNYKEITPETVNFWKRKKEVKIISGREGNGAFNEKYIRQVKGSRPSSPLYLLEHDDNNLDFLFKDKKGYGFHKYVAIVVTDSFCDLVLGKSYVMADSPLQQQVHHAYLDAMYYIRSLTGGWYLPFEIKSDKWAATSLKPFYQKLGNFITPAHGNKHRGYEEQVFGSHHWKRCQKLVSTSGNWSGNNMGAKFRGVNQDMVRLEAKNRPMIGDEAEMQIENFFQLLRHMPDIKRTDMNAMSKEQKWLQAWEQLTEEQKRPITDEQFLLTFGIKHEPQGRPITITNRGVEPQINNSRYSYDLPQAWMYNDLVGEQVNVYYDPYDMSRVLITNGTNIRFIASTAQLAPRALQDQYTGSRTYLNAVLAEKKAQVTKASIESTKRIERTDTTHYNAEAMLQGGVLVKEIKNKAEQKFIEQAAEDQETYLDEHYDFNTFFTQTPNQ